MGSHLSPKKSVMKNLGKVFLNGTINLLKLEYSGYRIDESGHYFVKVFVFFVADPERFAEGKRVDLALFLDIDVLVHVLGHLPRNSQTIFALARGSENDVTLLHCFHQLLGFLVPMKEKR